MKKYFFILIILVVNFQVESYSQELNANIENPTIEGTWYICGDTLFDPNFKCDASNYFYTFYENRRFVRNHLDSINATNVISKGKWILNDSTLVVVPDTTKNIFMGPNTFRIFWMNKNFFYETGHNDSRIGPYYHYWQRQ